LWDGLTEGGKGIACGWLTDRWGITWQITPKRLLDLVSDPDRAKGKRVMEAMMKMVKIDIAVLEAAASAG
jgi:predicted 3-demethylubiquinone-9 3-methyltransferase (glyoxalase superfamily)